MKKPTAPSPRKRAGGARSTLLKPAAQKKTSSPSNEEIMRQMGMEIESLDKRVSKPKPRQPPKKRNSQALHVEQERRYDLEAKKPDQKKMELYKKVRTSSRMKKELALIPKAIREAHEKKPLWGHQLITLELYRNSELVLDFSDPGTAKTRSALQAFAERRRSGGGKALVLAPRTLLECAWGNDAREFCADMKLSVAYSYNRPKAFEAKADIYITNIDGVKWLVDNVKVLAGFDTLIIDELTAFKHKSSNRSKAARTLAKRFKYRAGLTGTPNSNSITDVWHQAMVIDEGKRLGRGFIEFRNAVQTLDDQNRWVDRTGSEEAVSSILSDITVRHRFEDCMDIPPHSMHIVKYRPPEKLIAIYDEFEARAELRRQEGKVTAVNAAVLRNKLLQIASGAVYGRGDFEDPTGELRPTLILDDERAELTMDLIDEVDFPCLVFFCWGHQKEQLLRIAEKRGIRYALLDKSTPDKRRAEIVSHYQAGLYKVLFLHPRTGAHGLTLTRGRRTICISPFYEADALKQLTHRTYRGGQVERTETIMIEAEGTIEADVYNKRNGKYGRMQKFLELCEEESEEQDE